MTRHEIAMAEKSIKIPKLSLLKDEGKMFADLHEFLAMMERIYYQSQDVNTNNSVIFIMREIKYAQDLSDDVLRGLVRTLQRLASTGQGNVPVSFTSKFLSQLRKKKARMKKLTARYMEEIDNLRECQRCCWQSRAKVNKYSLMVDVAQKSLKYYTENKHEVRERTVAIKELKEDLGSRQKLLSRNIFKYEKVQEKENSIRNELTELAETLEETVTEKINNKVQSIMNNEEHNEEKLDLDTISKCIYDLISRSYIITESPTDITSSGFNKGITRPEELPRVYNHNNTNRILTSYQYIEGLEQTESIKHRSFVAEPNGESSGIGDTSVNMGENEKAIVEKPRDSVKAKEKGLFAFMKRKLIK